MLATDFAGWGTAFPEARERARATFGPEALPLKPIWLDYYLPGRHEFTREGIEAFGPQQ
jgi:hypothetical protein